MFTCPNPILLIKGNSMDGLFPDREEVRVRVQSDFVAESDLEIGRVVILKKKVVSDKHSLIIHGIIGKLFLNGKF